VLPVTPPQPPTLPVMLFTPLRTLPLLIATPPQLLMPTLLPSGSVNGNTSICSI
jgi:hypothetical protein